MRGESKRNEVHTTRQNVLTLCRYCGGDFLAGIFTSAVVVGFDDGNGAKNTNIRTLALERTPEYSN